MGILNNVRDIAGRVCMSTLHYHNSPLIMATCGSKGSPINIAQMVACVGQQSVGGKRCANGFKDRTTPHFPRHAPPAACVWGRDLGARERHLGARPMYLGATTP